MPLLSSPDAARSILYGEQARFFEDEIRPHLKHRQRGMVGMASGGKDLNASQFYITTGDELDSLDERHTLFGEVGWLQKGWVVLYGSVPSSRAGAGHNPAPLPPTEGGRLRSQLGSYPGRSSLGQRTPPAVPFGLR